MIWFSVVADIRLKGFGCFELVRAFGKLNQGGVKGPTHRKISPTLGRLHSCHNGVEGLKKRTWKGQIPQKPGLFLVQTITCLVLISLLFLSFKLMASKWLTSSNFNIWACSWLSFWHPWPILSLTLHCSPNLHQGSAGSSAKGYHRLWPNQILASRASGLINCWPVLWG